MLSLFTFLHMFDVGREGVDLGLDSVPVDRQSVHILR